MRDVLGVLGGMGPLATADFFRKLVAATPADSDAAHIPLLILSDPRIPPRPAAILGDGPSPLPALRAARDKLLAGGACAIAMPCNTAHYWHRDLADGCPVPFLSIVEASCGEVAGLANPGEEIGLIATRATLATKLYESRLGSLGYLATVPDDATMDRVVLPAIELVKQGHVAQAGRLLEPVVSRLLEDGARAVILACTETPLALDAVASPLRDRCIDSTAALARACVTFWQTRR